MGAEVEFKVGDKVAFKDQYSHTEGTGEIIEIREGHTLPFEISFNEGTFVDSEQATIFEAHELTLTTSCKYQVGGSHYSKHSIEPFDIMKDWKLGAVRVKVLKYLLRAPEKNGKEDIEKAKGCLQYLLDNYEDLEERGIL